MSCKRASCKRANDRRSPADTLLFRGYAITDRKLVILSSLGGLSISRFEFMKAIAFVGSAVIDLLVTLDVRRLVF